MTGPKEYAKALFLLSEEENKSDGILEELSALSVLMGENPEYSRLLDTPALSKEERLRLIDEALSAFDESLVNLVKIMAEARLTRLIPKLKEEYSSLYLESRGIISAEAITAVPMTESQLSAMKARLEDMTGKKVVLSNTLDSSILGGVMLRYSGTQLDGSVKTRLESFEKALSSAIV